MGIENIGFLNCYFIIFELIRFMVIFYLHNTRFEWICRLNFHYTCVFFFLLRVALVYLDLVMLQLFQSRDVNVGFLRDVDVAQTHVNLYTFVGERGGDAPLGLQASPLLELFGLEPFQVRGLQSGDPPPALVLAPVPAHTPLPSSLLVVV